MVQFNWWPQAASNNPAVVTTEIVPSGVGNDKEDFDAAQKILVEHDGRINRFIQGERQVYNLGIVQIAASHRTHPDVDIRYTNHFGAERIHLRVYPQPSGGEGEEVLTLASPCLMVLYGDHQIAAIPMSQLGATPPKFAVAHKGTLKTNLGKDSTEAPVDRILTAQYKFTAKDPSVVFWPVNVDTTHNLTVEDTFYLSTVDGRKTEARGSNAVVVQAELDSTGGRGFVGSQRSALPRLSHAKTHDKTPRVPAMNGSKNGGTIYTPFDVFVFKDKKLKRSTDGGSTTQLPYAIDSDGTYYYCPEWGVVTTGAVLMNLGYTYFSGDDDGAAEHPNYDAHGFVLNEPSTIPISYQYDKAAFDLFTAALDTANAPGPDIVAFITYWYGTWFSGPPSPYTWQDAGWSVPTMGGGPPVPGLTIDGVYFKSSVGGNLELVLATGAPASNSKLPYPVYMSSDNKKYSILDTKKLEVNTSAGTIAVRTGFDPGGPPSTPNYFSSYGDINGFQGPPMSTKIGGSSGGDSNFLAALLAEEAADSALVAGLTVPNPPHDTYSDKPGVQNINVFETTVSQDNSNGIASSDSVSLIHLEPFPPSIKQGYYFSIETGLASDLPKKDLRDTMKNSTTIIYTPYKTFSGDTGDDFKPWLHVSNGAHFIQGFAIGKTQHLYLDGATEISNALASALRISVNDIKTVIMDVPLGVIKKLH